MIFRDDIGRHNAVDKIHGECFLRDIPVADKILLTTGRISSEILVKAAKLGVADPRFALEPDRPGARTGGAHRHHRGRPGPGRRLHDLRGGRPGGPVSAQAPPGGRILGIDPGTKTIGVAVSDEMFFAAHGLPSIPARPAAKALEAIKKLISDYTIYEIVVGLPMNMDGTHRPERGGGAGVCPQPGGAAARGGVHDRRATDDRAGRTHAARGGRLPCQAARAARPGRGGAHPAKSPGQPEPCSRTTEAPRGVPGRRRAVAPALFAVLGSGSRSRWRWRTCCWSPRRGPAPARGGAHPRRQRPAADRPRAGRRGRGRQPAGLRPGRAHRRPRPPPAPGRLPARPGPEPPLAAARAPGGPRAGRRRHHPRGLAPRADRRPAGGGGRLRPRGRSSRPPATGPCSRNWRSPARAPKGSSSPRPMPCSCRPNRRRSSAPCTGSSRRSGASRPPARRRRRSRRCRRSRSRASSSARPRRPRSGRSSRRSS